MVYICFTTRPEWFLCPVTRSLFIWVEYPVTLFTRLRWTTLLITLVLLFLCFGIAREKTGKYLLLWLLISGPTITCAMWNQWSLCHQVQVIYHTWMPLYLEILSPLKRMISFFLVRTLLAKLMFNPQNRFHSVYIDRCSILYCSLRMYSGVQWFWLINKWREFYFFFLVLSLCARFYRNWFF